MKPSDASETIVNLSDAYGMIVKPSGTSGKIVLDVWWDQDAPGDKNRQNGAIWYNLGHSGREQEEWNDKDWSSLTTEIEKKNGL